MANRQTRDPGAIRQFEGTGQIGGVPSFAVDVGAGFDALAKVAGGLSARLGKLADEAAMRQGEIDGLPYGAQSGAAYLSMQAAQSGAAARAGKAPPEARAAIERAAARYGVRASALYTIAGIESGFNASAKNPGSSAGGPFQFVDATAGHYGLKNRYDWDESSDAAARLLRDNSASLRKVLGRDPTDAELYLAHQQGAGGAARLLANPSGDAVATVGADAVRLNGGKTGMTNAQFASIWLKRAGAGGAPEGDNLPAVPTVPSTPFALRRDGTIYGEAYDRSASAAYSWRLQTGVSTAMQAAYEENQDDPAALAGALSTVHDQFAATLADPEIREGFEKTFVERSEAYMRAARGKAETKMRAEETSAAFEGIAAQRQDVERQAVALGANPEGDRIMEREVARGGRAIDAAVGAGTLTPAEGRKAKADLAETAALGRVHGVFDALPNPEEKQNFARSLLEDWTAGKGPLAKLPYDKVSALSQTLWNAAAAEKNRAAANNKAEAARLKGLIKDDVASIGLTGQWLDPKESGLDPATVGKVLGPDGIDAWQAQRAAAANRWQATAGMETDTAEEISTRLATLEPKPGQPGFAEAQDTYEAAVKRAKGILDARAKDPAAAADAAFPQVAQLAETAAPEQPDTMQALVAARLQAQTALGLPELAQEPLTVKEATALARAVTAEPEASGQARAMKQLAGQVEAVYGPHAEAVMRQVLQVKGIDRETAQYGAQIFSRLNAGASPGLADRRQGAVLTETGQAEASGQPKVSEAFPLPNYKQQQMLLAHPELAPQYDEKFGAGAAQTILGRRQSGTSRRQDGGTADVGKDGESWTPDR